MDAEYSGWYRVGGHRLQFYATDEEIAGWLVETLPDEFGPYDIVGAEWHDGQWTPFSFPLEEIGTAVTTRRATNWWIRSQRLSPDVSPGDDHRHSFGGLILVQLGRVGNDDLSGEASIAVVDRIRNETTGEERRQPEYLRILSAFDAPCGSVSS